MPSSRTASTSAASRMPPAARIDPANPARTSRSSPRSGPPRAPSRSIAVQTTFGPASAQRARACRVVSSARLEPARGAHDAVCDVDGDDEPVAERVDEFPQRDLSQCRRPDDHPRDACLCKRDCVGHRAHAAAELHGSGAAASLTPRASSTGAPPSRAAPSATTWMSGGDAAATCRTSSRGSPASTSTRS